MLNQKHPEDERLAALAGHDPDALDDAALVAHVDTCDRCTGLVDELGALRASLADLPDLHPPRPLRLLPPADDTVTHDGLASWVRRLFAPALAAGATLALVGAIGTTGLGGLAPQGTSMEAAAPGASAAEAEVDGGGDTAAMGGAEESAAATQRTMADDGRGTADSLTHQLPAARSPWPMVLFTGVALVVAAALLRWIVVPRAG
jgi:hypothetical protein